jgi:hypothetical protein
VGLIPAQSSPAATPPQPLVMPAVFAHRNLARLADLFAAFFLAKAIADLPGMGWTYHPAQLFFPVLFGTWFLYEVPLTAFTGLTPAKLLLLLRVVPLDGSTRVGWRKAVRRWYLVPIGFLFVAARMKIPRLWLIPWVGPFDHTIGVTVVTQFQRRRLLSIPPAERADALRWGLEEAAEEAEFAFRE